MTSQSVRVEPSPAPWSFDAATGQIRDASGWALASVPRSLGDVGDAANGRLMAAAPELAAHLARVCDCLAEAVRYAQETSAGSGHNAGIWAAAITEARALVTAQGGQARQAAAIVAAAFEQEAEATGSPGAQADAERWRRRATSGEEVHPTE